MSKLANKIRKTTRVEPAPLGFGVAAARPRPPSLLLMVHGPASGMRPPADLTDSGLDALLLSLNPERESAEAARWAKVAGELPCGLRIPSATSETVAALKQAGIDFLAFEADSANADALLDTEMGYVLSLTGPDASGDTLLRAMADFSLDALWLADWHGPLTVQSQLELHRIHLLARAPLLVPVRADVGAGELECLRDVGVVGVAVDGREHNVWDQLPALRQAIDGLPPPRVRRREERPDAVLPVSARAPSSAEEEEEEEGEGEDFP
jgi:hypothetical protein